MLKPCAYFPRLQAFAALPALTALLVMAAALVAVIMPGTAWASVDVNRANVQQLQQIKGIGAKTAHRIVVERARGPFESLEHLSERLSGIGPKTIIKLKNAGLCAGTPDRPCASPGALTQVTTEQRASWTDGHAISHAGSDVVTPEILQVP